VDVRALSSVAVSNVLKEEKKQQVIALGRLGWSLRRIEREVDVRRETISAYLKEAGVALRLPRGRLLPAKPANEVTIDPVAPKPASPAEQVTPDSCADAGLPAAPESQLQKPTPKSSASICEPHREIIQAELSKGRNAKAIWQDLVDRSGFAGGYQSVKRFVRGLLGKPSPEACAVIETAPGEEAPVDYGSGPLVRDADSGKYRRARLFVLTLGYSRKAVRLLTFRSSSQVWAQLHEIAFRRLGGVTRVVVLDNLREGVLQPDIYDPTLNPLYRDVLSHYGSVALPCRVGDPDRKGKVESGVGHAQKTPLKGQRFENLEEAQAYLDHWEECWADTRIHGTTKRQVAAMFAEEKPALLPLPIEPFRYYQYGKRKVNLDGCVEVHAAYYSAPPGWVGQEVPVQWDDRAVRLLHPQTGQLLREHLTQVRGKHRIQEEDRPKQTPPGIQHLLLRAGRAGQQIGLACRRMYEEGGQEAVRRIQGMLALAKKHGPAVVDEACGLSLEAGAVNHYRFVCRYLDRGPQLPLSLRQVDPLIRELTEYRDFIQSKTQENQP
jgi:transposase